MKSYMKLAQMALVAYAAVMLSACPKTSNSGSSGTVASTPGSVCHVGVNGALINDQGLPCTATAGTSVCPANGQYVNSNGQTVTCVPGQPVYPYPNNPVGMNGCDYWTQMYGVLYVPMIMNNQYVCANWAWMQTYAAGSSYYGQQGLSQWYQQPPYGGSSCSSAAGVSVPGFSAAVCF